MPEPCEKTAVPAAAAPEAVKPISAVDKFRRKLRTSITGKLCLIALVMLLCQIPVMMISALRSGRQHRAAAVEEEVSSKWGGRQQLTGPILSIPLEREVTETSAKGGVTRVRRFSELQILPETLKITGKMIPEIRYRGIYEVVLYRSEITIAGSFAPDWRVPDKFDWKLRPELAALRLGIAQIKGITSAELRIGSRERDFAPGSFPNRQRKMEAIAAPLPELGDAANRTRRKIDFEIKLVLNGCRSLLFFPAGKSTRVELASSWADPSFTGGFLPETRKITPQGFTASWVVNEYNRNCPGSWVGDAVDFSRESCVGIELLRPVNAYLQTERCISYDLLVYLVVLIALLAAERLSGVWVHPLQYCIAGLSLVLFYALLLSLGEHIAFPLAYMSAAAVIAVLGGFYARLIFGGWCAAGCMAAVTALAYGAIYVILQLEDYALLAGSGLCVVLLAVVMGFTGKLNRRPQEE